jgi:cytochrome c oxidase subunit 4
VVVAHVDLDAMNIFVALAIATVKALLVLAFFMQLRLSPGLNRILIAAGVFWLAVLIGGTLDDVLTRATKTYRPFIGAMTGVRPPGEALPPESEVPHFE